MTASVIGLSIGVVGCEGHRGRRVERAGTDAWAMGEREVYVSCEYELEHAWFTHAEDWIGGVTITMRNVGDGPTRCGWHAALVDASEKVISKHVGSRHELAPGEEREAMVSLSARYHSDEDADAAWMFIEVFHGTSLTGKHGYNVTDPDHVPLPRP